MQASSITEAKLKSNLFSNTILINPIAALLKPKGSLSPLGSWLIPKIPTRVITFSAKLTAISTGFVGIESPANLGRYCSKIA